MPGSSWTFSSLAEADLARPSCVLRRVTVGVIVGPRGVAEQVGALSRLQRVTVRGALVRS